MIFLLIFVFGFGCFVVGMRAQEKKLELDNPFSNNSEWYLGAGIIIGGVASILNVLIILLAKGSY